jgi:hypothetical protein
MKFEILIKVTIAICLIIFFSGLVWIIITAKSFSPIADFKVFYSAGKIVAEGKGHNLFIPQVQKKEQMKVMPGYLTYYFNPPVFIFPFVVLSHLPFMTAYWVWIFLTLIALFWGVILLTASSKLKYPESWLLGAAALAFEPTYRNLHYGNISAFVLLLSALFFRDLLAGKDQRAGIWLALLMVKPELFLLSAFIVSIKRKWKFLKSYLGTGLVLLVLSVAIVGVEGLGDYIKMNWEAARSYTEVQTETQLSNMISFRAFFVRFLNGTTITEILASVYTALGLILLWIIWRGDWTPDSHRFNLQWSLTLLVSLLVAPHIYLQSLILVFPVAVLLLRSSPHLIDFRIHYGLPIFILFSVALSWFPEINKPIGLTVIQLALVAVTLFLTWVLLGNGAKSKEQ